MATSSKLAALLLVAAIFQCCNADGHHGSKKKVVIFVPQDVKTVHHHHVSAQISKHKGSKGPLKDQKPIYDSWSVSDGHNDEVGHSFGMSQGGMQSGSDWQDHHSSEGVMSEGLSGAQGYIGPPGRPLGHEGPEDHGGMQSSSFMSNHGFGSGATEDIQGTESARHEVRGFGVQGAGQGIRDFGEIVRGKSYISSGLTSNGFGKGNFGSEVDTGAGLSSVRGLGSGGIQGFNSGVQGYSSGGVQGYSSSGAHGFTPSGVRGLGGDIRNTPGFTPSANQVFDGSSPNLNVAGLGINQGFGDSVSSQNGYNIASSSGQMHGLGNDNSGYSVGFGAGGFGLGSGESGQSNFNSGGQGLNSAIMSHVRSHRGYSLGSSNSLSPGSSNIFRVYNSGSSSGPSSGFQENKGINMGGSHGISSSVLAGSYSLEGYSPDSGYATIRGGHHKVLGSGTNTKAYHFDQVSFGGHHGAGGFGDSFHVSSDEDIHIEEIPGWKSSRGRHRGKKPSTNRHIGGKGRHTSGTRGGGDDLFGDGDMKAYGSSTRPVTSSRFRAGGRTKKKESKGRKGSKNEGRSRPKRRPVKFPDDEPRSTRGKRHH